MHMFDLDLLDNVLQGQTMWSKLQQKQPGRYLSDRLTSMQQDLFLQRHF